MTKYQSNDEPIQRLDLLEWGEEHCDKQWVQLWLPLSRHGKKSQTLITNVMNCLM